MVLTHDDLVVGNIYSFNHSYLKPNWNKWKTSKKWTHISVNLKGYYLMSSKIPNLDVNFYIFIVKNSEGNYIVHYERLDQITINPAYYDGTDDLTWIKNGYVYDYTGYKIQINEPEPITNIELRAIKYYLKSNNCLDIQSSSDYPDNIIGMNYYKDYSPRGKITGKQLNIIINMIDSAIKKIGYFIALSPPIYNKFTGGALYKRGLIDFNL